MFQQNTQQSQNQQMTPEQQNALARQLILSNQKLHEISLGTYTLNAGDMLNVKMKNVGLLVGLQLIVRMVGHWTGNDGATPPVFNTLTGQGIQQAYPLLSRVQWVDIDGVSRINATPFEIATLAAINDGGHFEFATAYQTPVKTTDETGMENAFLPSIDSPAVYIDNTAHTAEAAFFLEIPLCLHRLGDLGGAVNLQSVLGDAYLQLTANSVSAMFDTVDNDQAIFKHDAATFTALGFTVDSFNVEIVQQYYTIESYPLPSGNFIALPAIDCRTVYAIEGAVFTSDNIAANAEKQISLPNNRNIRNALYTYYNSKLLGGGHENARLSNSTAANTAAFAADNLSRVKFLTGAGDYHIDKSATMFAVSQRKEYGVDLGRGVVAFDFRKSPASSSIYGTMQAVLVMGSSVSNDAKVGVAYESYYMKGASLANVTQ